MSDTSESSPENSPDTDVKKEPRIRRTAAPRSKKVAKPAVIPAEEAAPEVKDITIVPPVSIPAADPGDDVEILGSDKEDWPEPEVEVEGDKQSPTESTKRKRRRRKGKGQAQNASGIPVEDSPNLVTAPEIKPTESSHEQRSVRQNPAPQHQPPQRPKIDPEHLAKMAWKIYLAEVSEDGVALIGDNDAKDLSRRCFRLAEIFIEEQQRRR